MSNTVQIQLEKGGDDKSLSVSMLKEFLKSKGMTGSGDKGLLWSRCQLSHKVQKNDLKTENGENPVQLKPAQLRKVNAKAGLSPIGSNDELLFALVDHLLKNKPAPVSNDSSSSASTNQNSDNVLVAKRVLEMADEAIVNPISVLNIIDSSLTPQSSVSLLRKAYLKLSLIMHPDRIGRQFEQATKAFQILVSAFEQLTEPELISNVINDSKGGSGKNKTNRISRSNEGCFRTKIFCPRCKQEWTTGSVEGNPDWYYNVFMSGLKSFTCATCLCSFGCMTAIHKCPHCNGNYEYNPQDFHRKIKCGRTSSSISSNNNNNKYNKISCDKVFGFYEFYISLRNENNLKEEIKKQRAIRSKLIETSKRRNKSAQRRQGFNDDDGGLLSEEKQRKLDEKAFILRLKDICPRCGQSFLECGDEDAQRNHLLECTDAKLIEVLQTHEK